MMKGVITVAHLVNGFGAAGCLSPLSKAPAETNVCVCVRALWELPTTESVSECITGVVGLVSFLLLTHSLLAADWRDLATYRRFTKRPHRADWVKCTNYISLSLCWHNAHTQEAWPNVDVERDAAAVIDLKKSSFISKSKERCSQMIHSGVFLRNWSSNTVLFTMWLDRIIYIIYAICVYCYCIPIKIKIYKSWPGHFYIHRKKSKLLINFKSFHIYTQKNHCQLLYISRVTVAKRTFWPLASSVWWRRLETFCSARWRTCNSWTVAQSLPSAHPAVFGPVNEKRRRQWAQRQRSTGGFFLLQFTYLSVW